MNNLLEFRNIDDNEFDLGYSIIGDVTEWLHSKNIKQWIVPIPIDVYKERQRKNENYGLFDKGILKVVLSITFESSPQWFDQIGVEKQWWIHTLATSIQYRGNDFGQIALQKALKHIMGRKIDIVYLDCVYGNGFLPRFYKSLDFQHIFQKGIIIKKENWPDKVFRQLSNYYKDQSSVLLKWSNPSN